MSYSAKPRVDWTFPIWPMIMFAMQGAAVIWWGATLQSRVGELERNQADMKPIPVSLAKLEERTLGIRSDVADIKAQLTAKH